MSRTLRSHSSHWGAFEAEVAEGRLVAVRAPGFDADPAPLLENIPNSLRHPARIEQPMVRAGWLDRGPGPSPRRGAEPFVPVSWDRLTELLAGELRRVYDRHGAQAVFGGSYGWGSAGRFHHAQSQLHRFLNCLGGYTASVNTYSLSASAVILPHVVGVFRELLNRATEWPLIAEHTELLVCFGGIPLKNTQVSPGGMSRHDTRDCLRAAVDRGAEFVLFSPLRDDLPASVPAEWHALRPGTDVAVMLALAHTLITEGRHDRAFLDRYCAGFERFERYVLGLDDGTPKTPEWAEPIAELPAAALRDLARRMASRRTLVTVTFSLQRADHGEQPVWAGIALAALLGQIGLPGGGFGHGYGSMGYVGFAPQRHAFPALPQGLNPVKSFIPVARIADMLLHPGKEYDYDGQRLHYPDIRLIYWVGGNPFHHHQDLGRFRRALAGLETIVVHDPFWTPMARHADIVVPATVTLERDDIGTAPNDAYVIAMQRAVEPFALARDDYVTFSALAQALGVGERFTQGRTAAEWVRHLYDRWRGNLAKHDIAVPPFEAFWDQGFLELPELETGIVSFEAFRADPAGAPLPTPSGRIEIGSETIAGFGYDDCPGHPAWLEPVEWLGAPLAARYPLHLIANNPSTRLHSQLDMGAHSQSSKVQGREPIRLNPADAAARGIAGGDVVRVYNDRGACLAGAVLSEAVRPGVVQLSTGAWYDPLDPADPSSLCVAGNPNVLTLDQGTSKLAQGCIGQHTLVEIERWTGELPPLRAYGPPPIERRATGSEAAG